MIGQTLSQYRITEKLGEGGMGEVYKATDTKLDREVAIKVLPVAFAENKERLARFEREAKLLASLNHPNIATLFDLHEHDGTHFLVLELVPGETLAERIKRRPIPVDEALPIFKQIAEGLEAAHEKGVIHRDLKPANIKVTPEGKVKVLDFGLAKAMAGEAAAQDLSDSPTLTREGTETGALLGTAPYMSPEQVRGKTVDRRTDIWAFGCCLYEALTGKAAFLGETVSDTIAGILKQEPDWKALPPGTSALLRGLLRQCLKKDPTHRLRDVADAGIGIEDALSDHTDDIQALPPVSPPARQRILPWAVAVAAVVVASGLWIGRRPIDIDDISSTPSRFSIQLPPDQHVAMDMDYPLIAFSRDGRRLAWIGVGEPERRIYTRALDEVEVRPISGTLGANNSFLFLSPDGRWVAFERESALWKIPAEGGVATKLFKGEAAMGIFGGDWADNETIVLCLFGSGLYRIPASGGELELLTALDTKRGEFAIQRPQVLPEQRGVLFAVNIGNFNDVRVEVLDLDTGTRRVLIEDAFGARYLRSGHLVFGRDGTLFAAAFDLAQLEVVGPETPVLPNVQMDTFTRRTGQFAVSWNGTLAYIPGDQGFGEQRLGWVSHEGGTDFLATPSGTYSQPFLSPDGRQLAVNFNKGHVKQIGLYDLRRDVLTQFTFEGSSNDNPVWSPDGSRIVFSSNRAGQYNLFVKLVSGDASAGHLQGSMTMQDPLSWSPDGSLLAVSDFASSQFDVRLVPLDDASPQPIRFLDSEFSEGFARFSPTGGVIAYVSDEEGRPEVFIREITRDPLDFGLKMKVSRQGGWEPVWSHDGRELFYRSRDGRQLLSTSIRTDPDLEIGEEKVLIEELRLPPPGWYRSGTYDVSADGERFLMVLESESPVNMELVVVLNWSEELKRLVPTN